MSERPPEPDAESDRDDTDAGYRDTLEQAAYEQAADDARDDAGQDGDEAGDESDSA